jgi:hypothetical protein
VTTQLQLLLLILLLLLLLVLLLLVVVVVVEIIIIIILITKTTAEESRIEDTCVLASGRYKVRSVLKAVEDLQCSMTLGGCSSTVF